MLELTGREITAATEYRCNWPGAWEGGEGCRFEGGGVQQLFPANVYKEGEVDQEVGPQEGQLLLSNDEGIFKMTALRVRWKL